MRMSTGTIAWKALAGSTSSSPAPMTDPTNDNGMRRRRVAACPVSSWR